MQSINRLSTAGVLESYHVLCCGAVTPPKDRRKGKGGDFGKYMASECIFLTDDLTPSEYSGPEKDRSMFSEGSRKCLRSLRIRSKGFPQARLACSPSSPRHSEASEARFSLGSSPLSILGPGRLIYMYT